MKFNVIIKIGVIRGLIFYVFVRSLGGPALRLIIIGLLVLTFKKLTNKLISLLLALEIFSLLALLISPYLRYISNSCRIMFILIRLGVGEGVLGLALLVKFVRERGAEQTRLSFL